MKKVKEDKNQPDFSQHKRNEIGRVLLHAEKTLGLKVTTPEKVEALFPRNYEKQAEYLQKRLEKIGGPQLTPAWFGFDDGPAWPGFHTGQTWNGWAMPYFTKEVCDQIIEFLNEQQKRACTECENEYKASYFDAERNGYFIGWELSEIGPEEDMEAYCYKFDPKTNLCGLGAGSWTWNLWTDAEAAEINKEDEP